MSQCRKKSCEHILVESKDFQRLQERIVKLEKENEALRCAQEQLKSLRKIGAAGPLKAKPRCNS